MVERENLALITWFPPIIQDLYQRREYNSILRPNKWYDRGLILTTAAIHTCNCSLTDTRGVLVSTFGITPVASTILYWKNQIGTLAYQLNREILSRVMMEEIPIDEWFTALRDGKT